MVFHACPIQLPYCKHNALTIFHAYLVSLPHYNHEVRTIFSCQSCPNAIPQTRESGNALQPFFLNLRRCHVDLREFSKEEDSKKPPRNTKDLQKYRELL